MELYQLRYFSYAAKCENISEASRRLMVAQSSVSKAITGLEAELQTDLFIRNGKHIRLSSNGRLFAAKVAPILSAVDALPETFSSEKENAVRLRVLSASALLPDILARFRQIEPQTRFHLLQSAGSEETDLTIFSSPDEVADMGTVFLTREEIMLAIPVSSPLSLHKEAELELLGREPIVMPTEDQLLREQIERLCTASGFKLEVDFEGAGHYLLASPDLAGLLQRQPDLPALPPAPDLPQCLYAGKSGPAAAPGVGAVHAVPGAVFHRDSGGIPLKKGDAPIRSRQKAADRGIYSRY